MTSLQWILLIGAPTVMVLGFILYKKHASDLLERLNDGRRSSSKVVGRGQFIDGQRHIPVAMALGPSTLYYENADLRGYLELHWIHEVEYDDELATGKRVDEGRVLRLRCFSQKFEFILARATVSEWQAALPAHRLDQAREAYAK